MIIVLVVILLIGKVAGWWGGGSNKKPTPTSTADASADPQSSAAALGKVAVPDLVNHTLEEAEKMLDEAGLKYQLKPVESEEDANTVTDQEPKSGEEVEEGTRVTIYYSQESSGITIPDVTNKSLEDATSQLESSNLTVKGTTEKYSDIVAKGKVCGTDPVVGSSVAKGTAVTLIISKGPENDMVRAVSYTHLDVYKRQERTYQLLAQAAGRAGRGDLAGEVVLQTYQPEHYSITCAADQNYVQFYKQEILMRQMLQYPPVSHILGVLVLSKDEALATSFADELADMLRGTEGLVLLGPSEAPIAKLRDVYRYMIYGKSAEYECLVREKDRLEQYIRQRGLSEHLSVQFSFDHE